LAIINIDYNTNCKKFRIIIYMILEVEILQEKNVAGREIYVENYGEF